MGLLVKIRLKIYKIRFGHFLFVSAISSVCRRVHLFNVSSLWVSKVSKQVQSKNLFREKSGSSNYFCYEHISLKG